MTQSMLPKAKAKAVPAKKKAKVAKSKAEDLKKFKLAKKWFLSAAMKAKAGPLNGKLVRVCDEQSSKRAFGFEGKRVHSGERFCNAIVNDGTVR